MTRPKRPAPQAGDKKYIPKMHNLRDPDGKFKAPPRPSRHGRNSRANRHSRVAAIMGELTTPAPTTPSRLRDLQPRNYRLPPLAEADRHKVCRQTSTSDEDDAWCPEDMEPPIKRRKVSENHVDPTASIEQPSEREARVKRRSLSKEMGSVHQSVECEGAYGGLLKEFGTSRSGIKEPAPFAYNPSARVDIQRNRYIFPTTNNGSNTAMQTKAGSASATAPASSMLEVKPAQWAPVSYVKDASRVSARGRSISFDHQRNAALNAFQSRRYPPNDDSGMPRDLHAPAGNLPTPTSTQQSRSGRFPLASVAATHTQEDSPEIEPKLEKDIGGGGSVREQQGPYTNKTEKAIPETPPSEVSSGNPLSPAHDTNDSTAASPRTGADDNEHEDAEAQLSLVRPSRQGSECSEVGHVTTYNRPDSNAPAEEDEDFDEGESATREDSHGAASENGRHIRAKSNSSQEQADRTEFSSSDRSQNDEADEVDVKHARHVDAKGSSARNARSHRGLDRLPWLELAARQRRLEAAQSDAAYSIAEMEAAIQARRREMDKGQRELERIKRVMDERRSRSAF